MDEGDEVMLHKYLTAMKGVSQFLIHATPDGRALIGERHLGEFHPRMDHLACFVPGQDRVVVHTHSHTHTHTHTHRV